MYLSFNNIYFKENFRPLIIFIMHLHIYRFLLFMSITVSVPSVLFLSILLVLGPARGSCFPGLPPWERNLIVWNPGKYKLTFDWVQRSINQITFVQLFHHPAVFAPL